MNLVLKCALMLILTAVCGCVPKKNFEEVRLASGQYLNYKENFTFQYDCLLNGVVNCKSYIEIFSPSDHDGTWNFKWLETNSTGDSSALFKYHLTASGFFWGYDSSSRFLSFSKGDTLLRPFDGMNNFFKILAIDTIKNKHLDFISIKMKYSKKLMKDAFRWELWSKNIGMVRFSIEDSSTNVKGNYTLSKVIDESGKEINFNVSELNQVDY